MGFEQTPSRCTYRGILALYGVFTASIYCTHPHTQFCNREQCPIMLIMFLKLFADWCWSGMLWESGMKASHSFVKVWPPITC